MDYVLRGKELIFAKVEPNAVIPTKRDEDAGYDVYTCETETIVIEPNSTRMIDTGLAIGCSQDYFPKFFDKGGFGSKGIIVGAGVGDSGYRNKYFVPIINTSEGITVVLTNQSQQEIDEANCFDKRDNLFKYSEGIEALRKAFEVLTEEGIDVTTDIHPDVVLKEDCIIKPLNKSFVQFVMIEVPKMEQREVTYDEMLKYTSERGLGNCGSSGK